MVGETVLVDDVGRRFCMTLLGLGLDWPSLDGIGV
jgi:hypothetical protein